MIFESQYNFANISVTKAPILMKFETKVHKIVKDYHKRSRARFVATKRACARFVFVCASVCMDLYQRKFGISLLSYELKFQISLRSELSLQRYLQNCTDFQKSSIFNVFSIFSQLLASKVFKDG